MFGMNVMAWNGRDLEKLEVLQDNSYLYLDSAVTSCLVFSEKETLEMPVLAIGGAPIYNSLKTIRFLRHGCTNRPFYHIVIMGARRSSKKTYPVIEQLGTYDPLTNAHGEKLVSINLERVSYWMAQDKVSVAISVKELLGQMGFLPIHPQSYTVAWRSRIIAKKKALENMNKEENEVPVSS
ncbi:Ribosomal protein S16 [Trinorchestia longiramus]|nr:Ribosomal protein S16 [Trinorchestia longiramus]